MQYDGQDMIGPLQNKETRRDEANEYRKNVTLFYAPISVMQMQSTPVGGWKRKDCVPVTVGVPPVSSGTVDPFNLSTLP